MIQEVNKYIILKKKVFEIFKLTNIKIEICF